MSRKRVDEVNREQDRPLGDEELGQVTGGASTVDATTGVEADRLSNAYGPWGPGPYRATDKLVR